MTDNNKQNDYNTWLLNWHEYLDYVAYRDKQPPYRPLKDLVKKEQEVAEGKK